jgi:nucleotide-binding universal stress UspA family protein
MFSPKQIMVPTDFSEYSDKALKQAVDIAKQYNSRIYLLHVVGSVIQCTIDYCLDPKTTNLVEKESIAAAKKMIQEQILKFPDSKGLEIIADIRKGTPYEEILKAQQEQKADLIVIASHGQTGLIRHLMGSVAEKIIRHSKCSVLLVKN